MWSEGPGEPSGRRKAPTGRLGCSAGVEPKMDVKELDIATGWSLVTLTSAGGGLGAGREWPRGHLAEPRGY